LIATKISEGYTWYGILVHPRMEERVCKVLRARSFLDLRAVDYLANRHWHEQIAGDNTPPHPTHSPAD
jgi:hypothetical protein